MYLHFYNKRLARHVNNKIQMYRTKFWNSLVFTDIYWETNKLTIIEVPA